VPPEWLHLTTLIAGFCDEIAPGRVEAMACQAHRLLARTSREGRLHTEPWTPHITLAYGAPSRPFRQHDAAGSPGDRGSRAATAPPGGRCGPKTIRAPFARAA
jgi:hypothetical protein